MREFANPFFQSTAIHVPNEPRIETATAKNPRMENRSTSVENPVQRVSTIEKRG